MTRASPAFDLHTEIRMTTTLEVYILPQNVNVKVCFGGIPGQGLILQNEMSYSKLGVRANLNSRSPYIGVFVSPPQDTTLHLPDLSLEVSGLD